MLTTFFKISSKMASFKKYLLNRPVNSVKTADGVMKRCGLRNRSPRLNTGRHVDWRHTATVPWHMVIYILTPNRNLRFGKNNLLGS